ncbi:hypothetical protein NEPAR06_0242 [Nematocida parisii]|uniref:Uncharacterized protein n=1 Tax=Nematocida parisii (strain ERTm3) TaxID=935791 RepID=I3EIW5_NEMP3|nr:hypothetical protein NEQG_00981 [Nematocida parisii ERTm3]KAI5126344.1 hypothetical protein NEPAR03_0425 [Nematocida parisii]KAI5126423.1 hypothetical protein NEPAR08_0414 [Nematocida parisii]KAI5140674.1 hypothetical protein NEPAR04_0409 [Nematocida parisii]KAI5142872.1 hypothetical protein NEPAR07_0326 [Nematocida parisii]
MFRKILTMGLKVIPVSNIINITKDIIRYSHTAHTPKIEASCTASPSMNITVEHSVNPNMKYIKSVNK